MKIAIIPSNTMYLKDELFNLSNMEINRDNSAEAIVEWKNYAAKEGTEIHTYDYYSEFSNIDYFIFFVFDKNVYKKIVEGNYANKTIYIAFEPEVVDPNHSKDGIKKLLNYFKYVLTFNDDFIDNKRIFKFMYPCVSEKVKGISYSRNLYQYDEWCKKKLLVNISGNKKSSHLKELYSERRKVIDYFEKRNLIDMFELYGTNWEHSNFKCYKGVADSKSNVYSKFKFALCLENMRSVNGYITEKILDCFINGIVPVYWGSDNISRYIPEECFIKYESFDSIESMILFLENMDFKTYKNYLMAIENYLKSDKIDCFLGKTFKENIDKVIRFDIEINWFFSGKKVNTILSKGLRFLKFQLKKLKGVIK